MTLADKALRSVWSWGETRAALGREKTQTGVDVFNPGAGGIPVWHAIARANRGFLHFSSCRKSAPSLKRGTRLNNAIQVC